MGWFIFLLIIVILIIICANSANNTKERRDKYGIKSELSVTHLAGHPNFSRNMNLFLSLTNTNALIISSNSIKVETIKINDITLCSIKTEEEIRKDVTFTRLVTLGIFAFAFKKKTNEIHQYFLLSYKLNNVPIECVFSINKYTRNPSKFVYDVNSLVYNK